jgi:hypothetical protein
MNLFFGGSVIPLWKFFPSFLTSPENSHPATYIWIGLLAALLVFYYVRPLKRVEVPIKPKRKEMTAFFLFLAFSFLYCFYPHIHLLSQNKYTGKNVSFFNNSRNFRYLEDGDDKKGFRIKGGHNYDIYIDRKMTVKKTLTFRFTGTDVIDVTMRNGKKKLYQSGKQKSSVFSLNIPSLKTLAVGNRRVSHLGIETRVTQTPGTNVFLRLEIE